MSINVDTLPFDPELSQGAHNAVFVCLQVQPEEKVTLITDEACKEIAASLVAELNARGCRHLKFCFRRIGAAAAGGYAAGDFGRHGYQPSEHFRSAGASE